MAKGAYQIGFCRALAEHQVFELVAVSTASIGTLNGYALSSVKLEKAESLWRSVDLRGCKKLYQAMFCQHKIYELIDSICEEGDRMRVPVYTVCKVSTCKVKYVRLFNDPFEMTRKYLKASISIPSLVDPVYIYNECLSDGAIIDNTPIAPLLKYDLDLLIVVQFDSCIPHTALRKINCPVLFLNLQDRVKFTDSFDLRREKAEIMMQYGYNTSDNILALLESYCGNYEQFIELLQYLNTHIARCRFCGDKLIRNVNQISRLIQF